MASAVKNLRWVQDGIDEAEDGVLQDLFYIEKFSRSAASDIVSLGWVQDGIEETEAAAIKQLYYITSVDAMLASFILSLPWVQYSITDVEAKAISLINSLTSEGVAHLVVSLPWVQDGIEETEAAAIALINSLTSEEVARSVVSLPWVQDGIEETEAAAIASINNFASGKAAKSAVSLPWVQDGIEQPEVNVIEHLSYIANEDTQASLAIIDMPFLEAIEPPDEAAVDALGKLAYFTPDMFVRVMSHSALRDGISNDLAPIIGTLYGVATTNPGLIDILLDPSKVSLEIRAINLPMAGNVVLTIIRTGLGAARSMDLLEHAVRGVEDYMGLPFPINHVGLLYEDSIHGTGAGANFGTHITMLPKYDIDDGSHEATFNSRGLAHEVAHFFWVDNAFWVDEGAAEFLASVIDGEWTGNPVNVTNAPCAYATSIAKFEALDVARDDAENHCSYALGERLFVDLYRTLGDQRFREGFSKLYLASTTESLGIEAVREAFRSEVGVEEVIISRWYYGTEPYDLSDLDTGPVDPSLPSVNGRVTDAYVGMGMDGPKASTFSASEITDWIYLTLEYSYDVEGGPHEVPLEIVQHFQDGIQFDHQIGELSAEGRFSDGTSSFSVGYRPDLQWAQGSYGVQVFVGERKIAEVEYDITP